MHRWLLALCLILLLVPTWAWAQFTQAQRESTLLAQRVGYGRLATGGAGGSLCTVNTLANSGGSGQVGSLRHCLSLSGPQWIIFSLSGTITLTSLLPSTIVDKTIDGRGQNIVVNGSGLVAIFLFSTGSFNVILHNITINGLTTSTDGIRLIGGSNRMWFDHVTLSSFADESFEMDPCGSGANPCNDVPGEPSAFNVTLSWSRFLLPQGSGPLLICGDPGRPTCPDITLTLTHNWYDQTAVRHPFLREGKVHSFNNYYFENGIGAQTSDHGRFYSENDIFEGQPGGYPRIHCDPFGPTGTNTLAEAPASNCKTVGQWSVPGGTTETYNLENLNQATIFSPLTDYGGSYASFLETADAALRSKITHATQGAGRVDNPYNYLAAGAATLIAHYTFDEGSGTAPQDATANNLDGVITGGATYVTGRVGPFALSFNGTTGVVTVADNALLDLTSGFTLMGWVKPAALHTDLRTVVVKGYVYFLYASGFGAGTNQPLGGYDSGGLHTLTTAPALPANVWTHVAVTYDGALVTLYRGGIADGTTLATTGAMAATPGALTIGASQFGEFFDGALDDVRVYTGASTQPEIAAIVSAAGAGDVTPPAAPTALRVISP